MQYYDFGMFEEYNIDHTYDLQGTLGGPIAQDKAWFFASGRWWRLDQYLPGTDGLGEGGGPVIDDRRNE